MVGFKTISRELMLAPQPEYLTDVPVFDFPVSQTLWEKVNANMENYKSKKKNFYF